MFFPISGAHISPTYLVIIGFVIGILGGFFGVGGSFIAGPALRAVGLDWNFAVGTDLAHIVGKSVVAVRQLEVSLPARPFAQSDWTGISQSGPISPTSWANQSWRCDSIAPLAMSIFVSACSWPSAPSAARKSAHN